MIATQAWGPILNQGLVAQAEEPPPEPVSSQQYAVTVMPSSVTYTPESSDIQWESIEQAAEPIWLRYGPTPSDYGLSPSHYEPTLFNHPSQHGLTHNPAYVTYLLDWLYSEFDVAMQSTENTQSNISQLASKECLPQHEQHPSVQIQPDNHCSPFDLQPGIQPIPPTSSSLKNSTRLDYACPNCNKIFRSKKSLNGTITLDDLLSGLKIKIIILSQITLKPNTKILEDLPVHSVEAHFRTHSPGTVTKSLDALSVRCIWVQPD